MRYEPDERPPPALSVGLGIQLVLLTVAGVVLTPAVVIQASGWSESYIPWAVFAALAVSGATTVLQAIRVGRVGAGYVLLMGTSGVFIAVCVAALAEGGPPLMATLVIASSLFQFVFAARLSWLRRIVTPTVAGCVVMLIAVTVMPIAFFGPRPRSRGRFAARQPGLRRVDSARLRGGGAARVRGVAVVGAGDGHRRRLRRRGRVRPLRHRAGERRVVGGPARRELAGPGPGIRPGVLGAAAGFPSRHCGRSHRDGGRRHRHPAGLVARAARAADFRAVQGAVAADGVGNLLSGLVGTVPNTTYSSSVSVTEITRVASRSVGVCAGLAFLALAFLPKGTALLLAIPGPVIAAYLMVLIAILFMLGARLVMQDGMGYRGAIVAGVSFWIGVGFQNRAIFADRLGEWWGELLGNGMLAGGFTALLMTAFLEFSGPRRRRLEAALGAEALPRVAGFLDRFASRAGWSDAMAGRLRAVAEETLLTLADRETAGEIESERRLLLTARRDGASAELEFVAAAGDGNLEDRMALLGEPEAEVPLDHEISLRLLQHFASSVRHQQYHDTDVVTVRVDAPEAPN